MDVRPGLFSTQTLRRIFGGEDVMLERRVRDLPVSVERRAGPACDNCGFGTLHTVADGMPDAGALRCNRPGCGHLRERAAAATTIAA